MNLYEFEGKKLFEKCGITIPRGVVVRRDDDVKSVLENLAIEDVVVKAQVLSGKRGKNNGIRFCSTIDESVQAVKELFDIEIRGQYVAAVRIEEKLEIAEEHYLSITYDTKAQRPVLVYSEEGGVDIEDVGEGKIEKILLDIDQKDPSLDFDRAEDGGLRDVVQSLWGCFLQEDCRVVEINPLVKTADGRWVAADAKVALDDDAFYRHGTAAIEKKKEKGRDVSRMSDWEEFEPRTMMGRPPTDREVDVQEIDKGEKWYQGTAGKYIEMDGDIAILFSGGGASIANMDALMQEGLKPANYTEYSGNPPREKVHELAKIVLSKPEISGLWIAGGVANFTNVEETFQGIVDALDEIKPPYPIVVRRAGPHDAEGMQLMRECGERNNLNMTLFGKEVSMSESAKVLAEKVNKS